jgi:hypothetical protein
MRKTISLLLILALITSSVVDFLSVKAEPKTITVPDDYPTIAYAVGNATAGDTIFFKKGTYEGPIDQTVIIDKPLSLIGESAESTILNLHPYYTETWILTQSFVSADDAIIINANDVKLVNLTLHSISEIRVNGDRAQITGNNIQSGSTVKGLIITGSECNATNNAVLGRIDLSGSSNLISHNSFYSLILQSSDKNTINSNGFKYLQLHASNNNTILRNNISYENVQYVIDISNSTNNVFHGNRVEVDYWNTNLKLGVQAQNNTFYGNTFIGEDELVVADASAYGNLWDNGVYGNFWSNYNGTDIFGDGIGDVPYIIDGNNQDRYPLMKPLSEREVFERPFPTLLVVAVIAIIFAVTGVSLLVYFKKRKH